MEINRPAWERSLVPIRGARYIESSGIRTTAKAAPIAERGDRGIAPDRP